MRTTTDVQRRPPRRPRRPRPRWVLAVVAAALVSVVAGLALYGLLALGRSPRAYRLDAPTATRGTSAPTAAELAGRWVVDGGSQAGYRIREKLAGLPAPNDAVGRTGDVRGGVTIVETPEGGMIASDARVEVDLTTLRSDEPLRDQKVFPMFLEPGRSTPRFPTAIFQARAIDIPPPTRSGPTVDLLVHGQLTIRGERRDTEVHMRARLRDGRIELVGSTRFPLDRYGIAAPDFGGFVRVDDQVTVEFHLLLRRQG